jgi:hypothetical protein
MQIDSQSISALRQFHSSQIISALKRSHSQIPEPFNIRTTPKGRTLHMDYMGQLPTACTITNGMYFRSPILSNRMLGSLYRHPSGISNIYQKQNEARLLTTEVSWKVYNVGNKSTSTSGKKWVFTNDKKKIKTLLSNDPDLNEDWYLRSMPKSTLPPAFR